ncbi:MAG TPA: HAMP domain-containing sensor histidine kinase [Chryseolinea sp.]|nr:HAMP domain-containing sensor histidine kinase [Chryseolinea sp.]
MRLLQVSLRSSLLYSLILVVISIPVSLFSIRALLDEDVDEALTLHTDQFLRHIKTFNYLEDLETDLQVLDQLSYDIDIKPSNETVVFKEFQSVSLYDSTEHEVRPYRQLSTSVDIKGKHYILTVRSSLIDNQQLVYAVGLVQSALIILLATGLLLLNRALSRNLWKPFYKTLNQLKAYQLDRNEPIKLEKTNIHEFDDLNTTVSLLTDRNRKVFVDQKEFIENASHELQTPLAVFQSKLDVMMQNPSLSESDAAMIGELESTAQRMSRLNKNLLLLSKIDNEQFNAKETVDVKEVAELLLSNLKTMADVDNISITTSMQPLKITADKTLIEVLLSNLFNNAIRHNIKNGHIMVELSDGTLRVINSGPPVNLKSEKMFERFSKQSANSNSSGLGLAIVKKICDICSYDVKYEYQAGHRFTVNF